MIAVLAQSKPASKAQKTFRQLISRIESKREQLQRWEAYALRYNRRVAGEIEPLRVQLREGQRKMIDLIDELLDRPPQSIRWTRPERAKLGAMLTGMAGGLLDESSSDPELEGLHDKYSPVPYREALRAQKAMTESMLSGVFGLDLDDVPEAASTGELLEKAQKHVQERIEHEARLREQREEAREAKRARAGAAQPDTAQARREIAAREVSQSLREVYRKLVSALHPDRELDERERRRKTLLMQRVNQAYAANDLLTLLGLQLEIEQIDAGHVDALPPARLAHYNQILREQLAELEVELKRCAALFPGGAGFGSNLTPEKVDRDLSGEIVELKTLIRELLHDLAAFREPGYLRQTLKYYEPDADIVDLDDLAGLFDAVAQMQPERAGRKRRRK